MTINPRETTVSSSAVRDVYIACKDLGLLSDKAGIGFLLDESLLSNPQARIAEQVLIQLWQLLDENSAEPAIGLSIGQTIAPASKGILASWVSQAGSLKEALDIFFKNIELMNPSEFWLVSEQEELVTLTLENKNAYPRMAIERSMSAMITWAKLLTDQPFELHSTSFTFSTPSYIDRFSSIFGQHIYFKAKSNSITFDKSLLDLPIISSNHLLKKLIESEAKAVLVHISNEMGMSDKVKQLIDDSLANDKAIGVDQICNALAKSRQTLYRQLQKEGTDFQTLYDESRKHRAIELLRTQRNSMSAIALQLGYKDTSSFYKAFQRWTGMSPKQYQTKLREET